jgi:hypothetical protein
MVDVLGYAASIAVLATFLMPTMLRLGPLRTATVTPFWVPHSRT